MKFNIDWKLLLEYVRVLVWPGVVSLSLFVFFKENLINLINRIKDLEVFGVKVSANQQKIEIPPQSEVEDYKSIANDYKTKIDELGSSNEKIKQELINTQIYLDFERIYRLIFGSQIDILKSLRMAGIIGEPTSNLIFSFVVTQRMYSLLSSWSFTQYISFLSSSNLITFKDDKYFITEKGNGFLTYIEFLNLPRKAL
jgi:hypothetical protein